jgi:hypothetical protein
MSEQEYLIKIRAIDILQRVRNLVNEDGRTSMHGTVVPVPCEAMHKEIEDLLLKMEDLLTLAKRPRGKGMHSVCYCCENLKEIRDLANKLSENK